MREILHRAEGGDSRAMLAVDIFCYRIKKYIGAYFAALGQVDAIVFTGGIGENAASIRNRCCQGLAGLGIIMDGQKKMRDLPGDSPKSRRMGVPSRFS